ncbi:MAG: hypothetical protein HZB14_02505 [Actinobacteria bacterium]|nr:hypothetical protein [Actinomycetota bacterium]
MGIPSNCTIRQTAMPSGTLNQTERGVVVRWRVKLGAGGTFLSALSLRPRVVRGNSGVASGTIQPIAFPLTAGTREFTDRMPIEAGDSLALDITTNSMPAMMIPSGAPMINSGVGTGTLDYWSPTLPSGVPTAPVASLTNQEALFSADIEPDADGDGYGDETQDLCTTSAALQTVCPVTTITALKFRSDLGFTFTLSEAGALDLLIERLTPGRLRRGKCSTRAKRGKRCTIVKTVKNLTNLAAGAGPTVIPFSTTKLKPGTYRATIATHNVSGTTTSATVGFKVKRRGGH